MEEKKRNSWEPIPKGVGDMMAEDFQMRVFFEIHDDIPRGGPGSFESTRRAFRVITGCPKKPVILDVGCGPGMQTVHLSKFSEGQIVAVDNHQPFLNRLRLAVQDGDLAHRITIINGDMFALGFEPGVFDIIWAEGSIYIVGFEEGLLAWKPLLKRPGFLAATEVSWLKPNAPKELQDFWAKEYPAIRDVETNLNTIRRAGYGLVDHFTLPESDWWKQYYMPIQRKLSVLREKYAGNPEALSVLEMETREIDLFSKYADYYGYVFYVMKAES